MNKKILMIIIALVIVVGGGLGYWFLTKGNSNKNATNSTISSSVNNGEWNPYATEDYYTAALSDQLLSVGGGDYVVKMSVTLGFVDQDSYYKFKGYKDAATGKKAEASTKSSSTTTVSPMELVINNTLGELMMKANHEQLTDRNMLENYLKDGINRKLSFGTPIVKEIYIENYVLQ